MRLGIATDHGGFALKEEVVALLSAGGHDVFDFGAHNLYPGDDYPDFVIPLAEAVPAGKVERGVAICGSGVGASVCANKVVGIRAALIHDHFSARQGPVISQGTTRLHCATMGSHICHDFQRRHRRVSSHG